MRMLVLIGLIMIIAIGVSEVSASGDACNDTFSSGDVDLDHGVSISKHYRIEYFDIFMKYVASDFTNFISGLFSHF